MTKAMKIRHQLVALALCQAIIAKQPIRSLFGMVLFFQNLNGINLDKYGVRCLCVKSRAGQENKPELTLCMYIYVTILICNTL